MLIHHVILLLACWACVRATKDEKQPRSDVFDQLATASENSGISVKQLIPSPSKSALDLTSSSSTASSTIKAASIHYENSNGFIPMTSLDGSVIAGSEALSMNRTSNEDEDSSLDLSSREASGLIEDDPAYSTEARMFLSLPGPSADRRSFEAQEGQNEFEILKVTNETPAIANYHDFYENLQSNLNRNRGITQSRYQENEESSVGRTVAQNQRTKERIKNIERYLTNFHGDQEQDINDSYNQYFPQGSANDKPLNSPGRDAFEPEKVQTNFHQHTASPIYDVYGESQAQRQRTSSAQGSNYEDSGAGSRNSEKYGHSTTKNRRVNLKPVIVVEPGDFHLDMKYGHEKPSKEASSGVEAGSRYDGETRVKSEDRYGYSYEKLEESGDYSEEGGDYSEITEKPRRIHKSRRRPYTSETSKRLPKEHRGGHQSEDLDSNDSRKHNSPTRPKLHRPKAKPSYRNEDDRSSAHRKPNFWNEDDRGSTSEDISEEQLHNARPSRKPEAKHPKHQHSRPKSVAQWSQVGPNIEVSHSNGYQVDQIDKPKFLVPVNLNLVPLTNFDHSTALGNSQGFDFTNIPNFVTAAPIVTTPTPLLSTSQSVLSPNIAHPNNNLKNAPNPINNNNNNYGTPTSVPDIIVGQNAYQNPVQAVLMPQVNLQNKFAANLRTQYLPSTVAPMFAVTQTTSPNLHNLNPTMQSFPLQNFQSTVSPRPANSANQNVQHLNMNPASPAASLQPILLPQPILQNVPVLQTPYHLNSNYNILVNPNGLHGQNLVQQGHSNNEASTTPSPQPSTTLQATSALNGNLHTSGSQARKNTAPNGNGQFLATASFSVGNAEQQQQQQQQGSAVGNDNKFFQPGNNDNGVNTNNYNNHNNNYFNGNQNNQQLQRAQQNENFYQFYRDDQDNQKIKTYVQSAQVLPDQNYPINFNNLNYGNNQNYPNNQNYVNNQNFAGQLQAQQSAPSPSVTAQRPRDQNQQILKAANDIFENTWKQLQQLQTNDDAASGRNNPYQPIYRANDNLGSTSNNNVNTVNNLQNSNTAKAHLPAMGTQNVEIVNPNIRPSPVDMTFINPYQTLHHYPAAVLTTPIPLFSTTASFLTPRPILASTTAQSINLQSYVDSLTQMGAHSNQVNKLEAAPGGRHQDHHQRPLFNPINFVPNVDLMKSQSMLNSKLTESLPHQLNLVPLIPGGNFFKNNYGAQSELVQKPRLSSDLEKYAEEMFKESMKTIYSSHKWNNDRRARGNFTVAELNDLAKLKSELQRFKASLSESKRPGKDVLEGHHSETKIRTAEPSRTTKKPELSMAAIEQLFKSDFKHMSSPSSSESSQHKSRPSSSTHGSSRPSSDHFNDFKNLMQLSDYLTPPKPNSYVSKSPFGEPSKPNKKRPGSSSSRYNSNNNARQLPRPSALVSRPASGPEAAASNHLDSGIRSDGSRYEKHQHRSNKYSRENDHYTSDYRREPSFDSYPTFTTTSSLDNEPFKPSSSEDSGGKADHYDINHPRMHNLLGLLMKNKQLPSGSPQNYFRDEDELQQYFENEKRKLQMQLYDETMRNFQKKSDAPPLNMGPPAPPRMPPVRYYTGRQAA